MSKATENVEIIRSTIGGDSRILILMLGKPGTITVAALADGSPITVIVSIEELRAAILRLENVYVAAGERQLQ